MSWKDSYDSWDGGLDGVYVESAPGELPRNGWEGLID